MVTMMSSFDLFSVKDAVQSQSDSDASAFSDVSECLEPDTSVNERPRFGPHWEAQKAAFRERKRCEELERQKRIEEAIIRRELEEQRRIEAGEVESESGLSLSDSEEEEEDLSYELQGDEMCHTSTTCSPTGADTGKLLDEFPVKGASHKADLDMKDLKSTTKTLLHELSGLPAEGFLLAHGSALSAIRCLKIK
mmetsp:Transcript_65281/g.155836  ORF Transcript_65281/g.155836 Transcript_65281/m.155836 type:complete len:194 (+) Transcript_65281:38-619(+)